MRTSSLLLGTVLVLSSAGASAQQPPPPVSAPPPASTPQPPPQQPSPAAGALAPLAPAPSAVPPQPYPYPYAYPYPYPYPYPQGELPKYRNNAMRIAGIVLTSFASALMASGLAAMAIDLSGGNGGGDTSSKGLVSLLIGVPLMGGSTIFAGIGIPLWMVGGRPPEGAPPPTQAPSVGLGPGGLSLRF